ncbi:MAG: RNA methyltransferase [Bacteroidales bacterium]|jgi:TrmH family RNA methyltransferase|nr:RNA methyltransferase [Bacteroidales bacterium]
MYKIMTRHQAKMVLSLQKKKVREESSLFVIEGDKVVREYMLAGNRVILLAAKPEWLDGEPETVTGMADEIVTVSYDDLRRISSLKTPHNVLAVAAMKTTDFSAEILADGLTIALEYVQDPGNMGTIIRIAAWFGIKNIICSADCVDVYNPKVIQATMGAFLHVRVYYVSLDKVLKNAQEAKMPVYGATIDGKSIYDCKLNSHGIILLGNESKGISDGLLQHVTDRITIPGPEKPLAGIESLNVSMAAAIICSEFARRKTV